MKGFVKLNNNDIRSGRLEAIKRKLGKRWRRAKLTLSPGRIFKCFMAIPFVIVMRLLSPFVLIRIGALISSRIGHFCANTEMYLCEKDVGVQRTHNVIDIFYYDGAICNCKLAEMWGRALNIWPFSKYIYIVNRSLPFGKKHRITLPSDRDREGYALKVGKHLYFTEKELSVGYEYLRSKGLNREGKYVCLHCRDSAYLDKTYPSRRWGYHSHRDSNINDYLLAAEELTKRGYYVFRVGSVTNQVLETDNPMIIDYATNGDRTDLLDLFLMGTCSFMIAGGGGPLGVPCMFRRPVVQVNSIPLEDSMVGYNKNNITIPKKLFSKKYNRMLTFKEIISSDAGRFYHTEQYEKNDLEVIDNSSEEIRDVVIEMDERLEGNWQKTEKDKMIQEQFWSIIPESDLIGRVKTNIGTDFLRQNLDLLN